MTSLYLLKLGGSVLTHKDKPYTLREEVLRRVPEEIRGYAGNIILIIGVGSFGHPPAVKYRLWEGAHGKAWEWADTRRSVQELSLRVVSELVKGGIPAAEIHPHDIFRDKGRSLEVNLDPVLDFVDLGIVPVLHSDGIPHPSLGLRVISGDEILAELARQLRGEVRRAIFCIDVDGIYSGDPKKGNSELYQKISREELLKIAEDTGDFSRGMLGKAKQILRIPREVEVYVINGLVPGNIRESLSCSPKVGTIVLRGGFMNEYLENILVAVAQFIYTIFIVKAMDKAVKAGKISQDTSRKIVHMWAGGMILFWPLYTGRSAPFFFCITPAIWVFLLVATALTKGPEDPVVKSMTRNSDPKELLRGVMYFPLMVIILTLIFWWKGGRAGSFLFPALAGICAVGFGDGCAPLFGKKIGGRRYKLFGREKTLGGSFGVFIGTLISIFVLSWVVLRYLPPIWMPFVLAAVATVVEALSPADVDNLLIAFITAAVAYFI